LKKAVFLAVAVENKKSQHTAGNIPYSPFIPGRNIYFVSIVSTISSQQSKGKIGIPIVIVSAVLAII